MDGLEGIADDDSDGGMEMLVSDKDDSSVAFSRRVAKPQMPVVVPAIQEGSAFLTLDSTSLLLLRSRLGGEVFLLWQRAAQSK